MIYTITLNPSIDYIVPVDKLDLGGLSYMNNDYKLPGGKGINVSRILKALRADAVALGFVGGFTGKFIEDALDELDVRTNFVNIQEDTRINIKLKADQETEINGRGPALSDEEVARFLKQFEEVKDGDTVILSGSKPPSLPDNFYEQLIQRATDQGAAFAIDTTGAALEASLSYQPLLVKPNIHELEALFDVKLQTDEEVIAYGKKLLERGAKHVIISMGGDGALLITKQGNYKAKAPKGKLINSVGAGDSMVAGFISSFLKSGDPAESFKTAVASGSATAFSEDLATAEAIEKLRSQIQVETI
ncbi:tagatose-6-phosphate kinase [Oceanobacillus oncorhynchi subsp. incaldanensis]|uniref:Tagatose-6-phosphate kinase n=2 Tax=Oceanobacillus TaxID=182709 RepID=A0A0A1MUC0_9BACI|nr:1-phosphofructokinase [Oceanobacillus oncorhynchi]MDM8102666.1 1-phosphofructokinase [Oceanobacillus oncorhynchi]UUI41595.1 1-phosphofructokinase [Oceanobacillus oncorhynchi]GIO17739.1 tagatose-6-phosphate kinase [Oceanobacillus oncorhynchi subsp. incaldanensis]CEI83122.1 Tagatose-6-phosphate kinase [Oceanobacillus oncorhynchi]